jgi:hypothetical protein
MDIQISTGRVGEVDVQSLAVPIFKDEQAHEGFLQELDAATGGLIKSVIESGELKGKEGEIVYLHLGDGHGDLKAKRLLLVGAASEKPTGRRRCRRWPGRRRVRCVRETSKPSD